MASNATSTGGQFREPINKLHTDAGSLRQDAASRPEARRSEEGARARRHEELLRDQTLRPMTVNQVSVHGAKNIRRGFLNPLFDPLVGVGQPAPGTLDEIRTTLQEISAKLSGMQLLRQPPEFYFNSSQQGNPDTTPTDIDIDVVLRELPRFKLQTGTDVGNGEGSAYGSLLWRNMFGGVEELTLNARAGTRTRSAYSANLSAPLLSNPAMRVSLEGLASAAERPWASHEEVIKGGSLRFSWLNPQRDQHSIEYSGAWRQITGLAAGASPTVRMDAGDSLKSAVKHCFLRERRNNAILAESGYMIRTGLELAGVGPLGGDVAFTKSDIEVAGALPIPLPSFLGKNGMSIGGGLRMGMLWPMPLGWNIGGNAPASRLNDRYQLGGPTDVRGFKLGGLGPHDGQDSVGGDVFTAGGVNMIFRLPTKGEESNLRMQLFANGGRLVALRDQHGKQTSGSRELGAGAVGNGMMNAVSSLFDGPPSLAAGVGLIYAHPAARFELNFSLPLVLRRGEVGTKGLQLGVGINFL